MTFPSDRVPARARPAASRPPEPRQPAPRPRAGWTPDPLARPTAGRVRAGVGRSARPRARGRPVGVCVCVCVRPRACARSREREGCVCVCVPSTQGARRASDPGPLESGGRTRGRTHARAQASPALLARVEKLLMVPAGRSPRSPVLSVCDQYSLPPKPVGAGCVPHTLVPAVTLKKKKKKNLLTSLFLTSAKILLLVPLAQFHSFKLWPCLRLPKTCHPPQLLLDLEVGTFRCGGMISHQQPGHGLGSAAEAARFVLWSSVVSQASSLKSPFF